MYVEDEDFAAMSYSGSGNVNAPVQAVDINLVGDRASTSGCEDTDFAGFTPGNIALIQRGTCFFREKVDNAAEAGASAVIVFNQGNEDPNDDRFGLFFGTLDPPVASIPAVGTTFDIGEDLANTTGLVMRAAVDATIKTTTTFNVLADTPTGRVDRTVLVGAHLDSVLEARHQRQRQRLGGDPGDGAADGRARHRRRTGCASRSGAAKRTASSARLLRLAARRLP